MIPTVRIHAADKLTVSRSGELKDSRKMKENFAMQARG
jgi:hypothetical protein